MNIGAIIQARLSSSRLPNKLLLPLPIDSELCVLQQLIRRLKKSKKINRIIIATSDEEEDKKIVKIAERENVDFYCGSLENVLERVYKAAEKYNLELIVRITGDNPCIDPELVDKTIESHFENKADYSNIGLEPSYPRGFDNEVFSFNNLKYIYENAVLARDFEHICTFFYLTHPDKFKINNVVSDNKECIAPELRLTLDTKQDYILLCAIYGLIYKKNMDFTVKDVVKFYKNQPWIKLINENVFQKSQNLSKKEQIVEAIKILNLQQLEEPIAILKRALEQ